MLFGLPVMVFRSTARMFAAYTKLHKYFNGFCSIQVKLRVHGYW